VGPEPPPQEPPRGGGPNARPGAAVREPVRERHRAAGAAPGRFVRWAGGALANVAVAVARSGLPAALVGGGGADGWGSRLARGLEEEGVSTEWLAILEGVDTPVALVEFGPDNEPFFQVYGEHIGPTMAATSGFLERAITASQALVVGSNTMVGETEREVTRQAIGLARAAGLPVLLDPNHRPNRWRGDDPARERSRELVAAATVVKLNRSEAELITGIREPLEAARALVGLGPQLVVVTDGEGEVGTAGAAEARHQPQVVETVSPLGAGDAFMGGLAAGLARLGWDLSRVGEVLPEAATAAASVCGRWGAQ